MLLWQWDKALELAREIEDRGYAGLYCPSFGDGVGLCEALALRLCTAATSDAISAGVRSRHAGIAEPATPFHSTSAGWLGPWAERNGSKPSPAVLKVPAMSLCARMRP